jgi:cbb3-type cytochrome oxidase cytochrome c subunit
MAWVYVVFVIALITSAVPVLGANLEHKSVRIYLPKENVRLENRQILVGNHSSWIPVAQLSADQNGFYVLADDSNYSLFQWECSRCGHDNWFWDDICWYCGRER